MNDTTQTTLLDPPYDGHAVWHQHAFPPDGCAFPGPGQDEDDCLGRFDAVENSLGRVFVWNADTGKVVCVCDNKDTAVLCAVGLCMGYAHG
jgi:hypothetical protein